MKNSLKEICKNRLPCEFNADVGRIVDDFWDVVFEENEFRFYLIEPNGVYLNDWYLPIKEDEIASIHYKTGYMNYLKNLQN